MSGQRVRKTPMLRHGFPLFRCGRCRTPMIRKYRIIKPWGNRKRIYDLYCPKCEKFTRRPTQRFKEIFGNGEEIDGIKKKCDACGGMFPALTPVETPYSAKWCDACLVDENNQGWITHKGKKEEY